MERGNLEGGASVVRLATFSRSLRLLIHQKVYFWAAWAKAQWTGRKDRQPARRQGARGALLEICQIRLVVPENVHGAEDMVLASFSAKCVD